MPTCQTAQITIQIQPPTEPTPEPLQHAWYLYDGDGREAPLSEAIRGNMVKGIVNKTTTYYPGRHYNLEVTATGEKAQKFYFAGGATIAVRTVVGEEDTLQWVLSDHLNSASSSLSSECLLCSEVLRWNPLPNPSSTPGTCTTAKVAKHSFTER